MKANKIFHSLLLLAFLVFSGVMRAQVQTPFECRTNMNAVSSIITHLRTCTPSFLTDYNNAPIINLYVNVHIWNTNENLSTAVMVDRVRKMIDVCNETLDNMQQTTQPGPNGQYAPRVEDAKIRLKLYSDPANTADVNGGIWVYPKNMWTYGFITTIDYPYDFPGYVRRYSNVIDITLVNFGTFTYPNGKRYSQATGYTSGTNSGYVVMADLNAAFEADNLNGTVDPAQLNWRSVARSLNHEMTHILSLTHTFECTFTQCLVDIDVSNECYSNCPSYSTCGGEGNADYCPAPSTNKICKYANSQNIMAYDWYQHAITRCQWERVYETAIAGGVKDWIKGCPPTANINLILSTSPDLDYRASQSITSTSAIAVNRDVTYQAPTIAMNGGFQVPLGAAFFASPSTFPCCSSPVASINDPGGGEELSFVKVQNNREQATYNVFPIPFTDRLTLQAAKLGMSVESGTIQLQLLDLNGRVVHTTTLEAAAEMSLSVPNLPPGQYFVKLSGKSTQFVYRASKL